MRRSTYLPVIYRITVQGTMGHVFLSYSRKDRAYARKLADDLRARGLDPWNDEDIEHGARWWRTIVQAIKDCSAFVVIMTPESEESRWVEREILLAEDEDKLILPLLLRGKQNPLLITTQHADVTDGGLPPKRFYTRLRRALPDPEPAPDPPPAASSKPPPKRPRQAREPAAKPSPEKPPVGVEPALVHVPAGPFLMGSKEGFDWEKPQHTVTLSEYWIGKYPVTNAEYQAFVREAGHRAPGLWDGDAYPAGREAHPVVHVSWDDAMAYCRWLSEKTGKAYGLPTEAQWEKAARGTDGRIYPWGDEWDATRCNSRAAKLGGTSLVGKFSPQGDSLYGCADLAGNVWEWCADWFDKNEYARRVEGNVVDPEGPGSGSLRVLRGGSFLLNDSLVRCAARNHGNPNDRGYVVGFRFFLRP